MSPYSDHRGVMSSQETTHISLIKVTPISGKGTLGTWWCHGQRGPGHRAGDSRRKRWHEVVSKPCVLGRMRTSA